MSSKLAGDTHFATHNRPSNLLHSKPSLRERARIQSSLLGACSTPQEDYSGTDMEFEVNDSPSFPDVSPTPDSQAEVGEEDSDFAFMHPNAEDPFAPSNFHDEYCTFEFK